MQELILKFLGIATALAMEIAPFSTSTPQISVYYWAQIYGVSYPELYNTLEKESGFQPCVQSSYPDTTGPNGREDSWGVSQIHLPDHPGITREEACDPNFAIQWAAKQFHDGKADMWTAYRHLDRSKLSAPPVTYTQN